jgi:hypothetical protein
MWMQKSVSLNPCGWKKISVPKFSFCYISTLCFTRFCCGRESAKNFVGENLVSKMLFVWAYLIVHKKSCVITALSHEGVCLPLWGIARAIFSGRQCFF